MKQLLLIVSIWTLVVNVSCDEAVPSLFSLEDEIALGAQLNQELADDSTFSILSKSSYAQAYEYSNNHLLQIVVSIDEDSASILANSERFQWNVSIYKDLKERAFILPGGYLYVSTGMINALENVDQFAGLIAHLAIHSDERHATKHLLSVFESAKLQSVSKGGSAALRKEVVNYFKSEEGIHFSISDEKMVDIASLELLSGSDYACNSGLLFLQRLYKTQQQGTTPPFINSHKGASDRIQQLTDILSASDCNKSAMVESGYKFKDLQNSLPK
jgi:beta-barrel assembly-enhancing protease